uniref:Uncharacterized protein n=1 Tax=Aegilops tauschii subsp. strangulata TaxID=200361 RepID=A0A453LAZ6_AEGTS
MFFWEPYVSKSSVLNCGVSHFSLWTNRLPHFVTYKSSVGTVANFGKKFFLGIFFFEMFWQEVASIPVPHFLYSSCFKTYAEGKMTPKAVSIISKYKETCSDMTEVTNSSCSGDGGQPITKRKKLREALLRHCQELDEICRGAHWISPRYTLLPSASDGMYHASVRLRCLDFEMSITGDLRPTPHEARCSAASNMILELHKKAEQEQ